MIVQSDETDNALQHLGTKRINVAFPCFGQNTESLRINAFAMLPILTKGRSDASDFPFCMALIEAQAKSSTLGSTLKCDGFRVAAMNFGTQLCTCRKRCRDTCLLCKQQGFFLFGQARVHLADDVEIRIVVQQLAGSDGVLTIKDIVVTVTITDLGCVGNALVKFERAVEPRPPGTDVTGSLEVIELDPDVPAVWWMFEDVAAVIRMRDYLDLVARGLVEAAGSEEPESREEPQP